MVVEANCNGVVNPLMDTQKYLPPSMFVENYGGYEDPEVDRHLPEDAARDRPAAQRELMREYEKHVVDTEAHEFPMLWWYRIVPLRSYVKGWKIGPSHYVNQDLANIWLDKE